MSLPLPQRRSTLGVYMRSPLGVRGGGGAEGWFFGVDLRQPVGSGFKLYSSFPGTPDAEPAVFDRFPDFTYGGIGPDNHPLCPKPQSHTLPGEILAVYVEGDRRRHYSLYDPNFPLRDEIPSGFVGVSAPRFIGNMPNSASDLTGLAVEFSDILPHVTSGRMTLLGTVETDTYEEAALSIANAYPAQVSTPVKEPWTGNLENNYICLLGYLFPDDKISSLSSECSGGQGINNMWVVKDFNFDSGPTVFIKSNLGTPGGGTGLFFNAMVLDGDGVPYTSYPGSQFYTFRPSLATSGNLASWGMDIDGYTIGSVNFSYDRWLNDSQTTPTVSLDYDAVGDGLSGSISNTIDEGLYQKINFGLGNNRFFYVKAGELTSTWAQNPTEVEVTNDPFLNVSTSLEDIKWLARPVIIVGVVRNTGEISQSWTYTNNFSWTQENFIFTRPDGSIGGNVVEFLINGASPFFEEYTIGQRVDEWAVRRVFTFSAPGVANNIQDPDNP